MMRNRCTVRVIEVIYVLRPPCIFPSTRGMKTRVFGSCAAHFEKDGTQNEITLDADSEFRPQMTRKRGL
jgi:hypothetical protein